MAPATTLFNRISIVQKFILILILYVIPVLYITYSTVTENTNRMTLINTERQGLFFIQKISPLFKYIAQSRGLTNAYLNGNAAVKPSIIMLHKLVAENIKTINSVDQNIIKIVDPEGLFQKISSDWNSLQEKIFTLEAPIAFSIHTKIIEKILKLTVYSSENSNLTLDLDKSASYLIELITKQLPLLSETIGKTRGMGAGVAAKGSFTSENFVQLSRFTNIITEILAELEHGLNKIKIENRELSKTINQLNTNAIQAVQSFAALTSSELINSKEIIIDSDHYFSAGTKSIEAVSKLFNESHVITHRIFQNRESALQNEILINILSSFSLLAAAIYIFTAFYHNIMGSIRNIKQTVELVAKGDLTVRVELESNDEMKQIATDLNKMIDTNHTLVEKVRNSAQLVVSSALENSSTSSKTSDGINQQNEEIEQVATAMNELTATVHEVAHNTDQTADATRKADAEAEQSKAVVEKTIQSIGELSKEINAANNTIKELGEDTSRISSVLDVIQNIADQTNLLALNAAIEAARAGESGRGFAVVADEVRTLAIRTQESTEEIRQMIEKLQQSAVNAEAVMHRGNQQSKLTVEHAAETGEALNRIAISFEIISNMSEQIASASVQQSAAADDISRSIYNVKNISEATSLGAIQTAKNSEELKEIANSLMSQISLFRLK